MIEQRIRILLADDHPVLRAGLRALLNGEPDLNVVAEAGDGAEALRQIEIKRPDVVVLDLTMPGMSGLEALERITRQYPETRVLVLTMHADKNYIRHVVQAGGAGYILKSGADTELITAIRQVAAGKSYLNPEATQVLLDDYLDMHHADVEPVEETRLDLLSSREREVLVMTAQGYSSREIGEKLFISPKTVDTYRQRLMEKLALDSRAELVRYALQHNLLDS